MHPIGRDSVVVDHRCRGPLGPGHDGCSARQRSTVHSELRVLDRRWVSIDEVTPSYEALADSTDERSETVTFPGPSTHFADFADVHVMTTASLIAAKALHPAGDWDVRRFRPTMVVEAEGEGFVEDEWIGSRLGVGATASFEVFMKTIRCNLPTRLQPGLGRDNAVARVLRDEHDFCLGVYGAFREGGVVALGDPVSLVSA